MTNPYHFTSFGYDLFEAIQSLANTHDISVPAAVGLTLRVCSDLLQHGKFVEQLRADLKVEVRKDLIAELQKHHGSS